MEERHTLGKAFVQIVPSAEGISGSIQKALGGEADVAGEAAGKGIAGKIKGILATAAIGETLRQSIMQGAALEQSLGGVETLFKEHADIVIKNASSAYKTAGLSANAYMETATSFAASLLQSVEGNTAQAAELTDMALVDMSDNANKMGTSMELIQNAYQGFAKQNYTMLDNLKLGYGGTKSEMERLLADATKLTGIEYNIDNLSDVYSAIHVIQEDLGITGTTAKEAAETLSGSFASMKAAAQDFMANIVLGRDVGPSMIALAETAGVFFFDNLMPAIGNIITSLPEVVFALVTEGGPKFMESGISLIESIAEGVTTGTPTVLEKGKEVIKEFIAGIINRLPDVITTTATVLSSIVEYIKANLPSIIAAGGDILANLVLGILDNLPQLLSSIAKLTGSILKGIVDLVPIVLNAGKSLVVSIASGLTTGIATRLTSAVGKLKTALTKPIDEAKEAIKTIVDNIKSFFDIELSFSGIKLPHISMSWDTSGVLAEAAQLLGLQGIPNFDVEWYGTGGVFNRPSIIGVGEAGTEAVVPLDSLWSKMDEFISMNLRQTDIYKPSFNDDLLVEHLDSLSRVIVYAIAKGFEGIGIKVDRREIARFVKEVVG